MRWQEAAANMKPEEVRADTTVKEIPIALIIPPELPARAQMDGEAMDDLCDSMRAIGLIQPIAVIPRGDQFEVLAGHRRLLAAQRLEWEHIKARVYPADCESPEAIKLHENVVREELNPAEECIYIQQLVEAGHETEEELCKILHKGPSYIAERFRLLRGHPNVFEAVRTGRIGLQVARELNFFKTDDAIVTYLDAALRSGCAARVVRQWRHDWELNEGLRRAPVVEAEPPPELPPADPFKPACVFCGGDRDPWNLESVYVHRWEREYMHKLLGRPSDATDKLKAEAEARASERTSTNGGEPGEGPGG